MASSALVSAPSLIALVGLVGGWLLVADRALAQGEATLGAAPTAVPAYGAALAPKPHPDLVGAASRYELSGDMSMLVGRYGEAVEAYEASFALFPALRVSEKLAIARFDAARPVAQAQTPAVPSGPLTTTPAARSHSLMGPVDRGPHEGGSPQDAPEPIVKKRWYGYQTLLVDVTDLGLFITFSVEAGTGHLSPTGLKAGLAANSVIYFLGGPVVHMAHRHYEAAGVDLAVRVGFPLAGALVAGGFGAAFGAAVGSAFGTARQSALNGALLFAPVGITVGIIAAVGLDAGAIAVEDVPVAPKSTFWWAPHIVPTKTGTTAGIVGAF